MPNRRRSTGDSVRCVARRTPGGRKLGKRSRLIQVACIAIAVLLGMIVLGKRVGAEPPAKAAPAAPKADAPGKPKPKPAAKGKDAGAAAEPVDAGSDAGPPNWWEAP